MCPSLPINGLARHLRLDGFLVTICDGYFFRLCIGISWKPEALPNFLVDGATFKT